ncbi:PaaI family thioesterase [Sphingobium lactosutens]|uniref:PaaI family thioesterase n=1 Tax=Sphingobium lactosutens TaxID=522773 RepID=UPI0015B7C1F6|nr:PaaI family thioesterase [Sphingobium lactosutens]NWK96140.1 PaaI family thioesterase [Sphingobium lactosutens]
MIARTPYAQMLGIESMAAEPGMVALRMPATAQLEGRPGFLYGGVIASLLELACLDAIAQDRGDAAGRPKPINMSFDFLRGGLMIDSFAEARLSRVGRRIVHADAICWQADRNRPMATGRMHLLLGG